MAAGLSTGIEVIDAQHGALISEVSELIAAARTGAPGLRPMLEGLETDVLDHFATEERLMADHAFPVAGPHREAHAAFVSSFQALGKEIAGGTLRGRELAERLEVMVGEWLELHIEGYDQALGRFLAERGVK